MSALAAPDRTHAPRMADAHARRGAMEAVRVFLAQVQGLPSACLAFQHTQQGMRVEPPGDVRALGILAAPGHIIIISMRS